MYTCNGLIDIFGFLSCKNTVSTCDQIMRIKNSMQFHFQKIPMQLSAKHVRCSYTMFMFAAVLKTSLYIMCMLCCHWLYHMDIIVFKDRDHLYIRSEHLKVHNW